MAELTEAQRDDQLKRRFEDGVASADLRQHMGIHWHCREKNFSETVDSSRIHVTNVSDNKPENGIVRFISDQSSSEVHYLGSQNVDLAPVLRRLDDIDKKLEGQWTQKTDASTSTRPATPRQNTPLPANRNQSQNFNS